MSLTQLLVPSFTQMLQAMSAWLDKAAAQDRTAGADPEPLLSKRLAPDMYPLASQTRFACFQAQEALSFLKGEALSEVAKNIRSEGWKAGQGEHPGSMADAQARISETLVILETIEPHALDNGVTLPITLALPNGMSFDMTGEQYARDWSLPQFYFHLNMTYAILRNHGTELGKADYVPHMFAYLRPGTMPQAQ